MEEAGDKMEGNIDEIKITYSQRMQKLEDIIKKVSSFRRYIAPSFDLDSSNLFFQLIVSKETLTKNSQLSRKHVQDLQTNLSKLLETNDALNSDLQTASKTIVRIKRGKNKVGQNSKCNITMNFTWLKKLFFS